jgi:hypothetical protein
VLEHGLHLAVLWSLAVAQPLFDLLGRNAEFFAIRRSAPVDIIVFAVALVVLPPLVLWAIEALLGLVDERLMRGAHLVFVAALVAVIALTFLKRTSGSSAILIPLAAAAGAGAAVLYARARAARLFLTVLGPAPLLFVLLFLFNTPVSRLIDGSEAEASAGSAGARAPVVMLVFDELPVTSLLRPDGRIDAERYPNFAALAGDSTWFRNTAAVDSATEQAVPAILTGRTPREEGLPTAEDHPQNLFTLLGGERRMHVQEPITSLCPESLCERSGPGFTARMRSLVSDLRIVTAHVLLPDDVRRKLPSIDAQWQAFGGQGDADDTDAAPGGAEIHRVFNDREDLARRFVQGIPKPRPDEPGPLSFLHVLLPHVPWQYLPDGKRYGAGGEPLGLVEERWSADPAAPAVGFQRHLLQLGMVDRLIGDLRRKLRADGTYDDSVIVVTADHGVSFRAGQGRRGLTPQIAMDVLPVPFFIKAPGQRRGRIMNTQIQSVDILPTIASALGIRIPWRTDGTSGFSPGADRRVVRATAAGVGAKTVPAARLRLEQTAAIQRQVAMFGEGGTPRLRDPQYDNLLGRRIPANVPRATDGSATLQDPARFAAVDHNSDFLPVYVTGSVHGTDTSRLAVAVNGQIGSIARVVKTAAGRAFAGFVPESLLRDGSNRVELLAISGRGAATRLRSLGRVGGREGVFRLEDGEIHAGDDRRYRIEDGALVGGVDRTALDGDVIHLSGWAVDPQKQRPVDQVVGFGDDGMLFSGAPDAARSDLTKLYKAPPDRLGFAFDVPQGGFTDRPRVFALRDGVASPLKWFCGEGGLQDIGC